MAKFCNMPETMRVSENCINAAGTTGCVYTPDQPPPTPQLQLSPDYEVLERPIGWIRPVRIICLGAGGSGINLAYQVQHRLRKAQLVLYEKNPKVGGTWYENRYPGCKCDIRESSYYYANDWTN